MPTVANPKHPLRCKCGRQMITKVIHTDLPGTLPATLGMCPDCDFRHCSVKSCNALVRDPFAKRCPLGHSLDRVA